jgi:hypothetical protein
MHDKLCMANPQTEIGLDKLKLDNRPHSIHTFTIPGGVVFHYLSIKGLAGKTLLHGKIMPNILSDHS